MGSKKNGGFLFLVFVILLIFGCSNFTEKEPKLERSNNKQYTLVNISSFFSNYVMIIILDEEESYKIIMHKLPQKECDFNEYEKIDKGQKFNVVLYCYDKKIYPTPFSDNSSYEVNDATIYNSGELLVNPYYSEDISVKWNDKTEELNMYVKKKY